MKPRLFVPCLVSIATVLAVGALSLSAARAGVVGVKMNWDIGQQNGFTLTYNDAHITIASKGIISPPSQFVNGPFSVPNSTVTPGVPDDTLQVDWAAKNPVTGKSHIGVGFNLDNLDQKNDVRVISATLTGVSGTAPGGGSFSTPEPLSIPGPPSIMYGKSNSAAVTLSISDPSIIAPVEFSSVEFFKSAVEPSLESLNAVDFGAVPKDFLLAVSSFVLTPGSTMDIEVPGIAATDWLLAQYTTSWIDPTLSGLLGVPIPMSVDTWFAGQLVPEPSTFILGGLGLIALLLVGRRRGGVPPSK
jgi:hypothetical protein